MNRKDLKDIQGKNLFYFAILLQMKTIQHEQVCNDIFSVLHSYLTSLNEDSIRDVYIYKHLFNYIQTISPIIKYVNE